MPCIVLHNYTRFPPQCVYFYFFIVAMDRLAHYNGWYQGRESPNDGRTTT